MNRKDRAGSTADVLPPDTKPLIGPGTPRGRAARQERPANNREVAMGRFFASLFGQVVVALAAGIVLGLVWPDFAIALKPLGDVFIKLIKMVVAPLVFGVVVHGIVGAGDLRKVG